MKVLAMYELMSLNFFIKDKTRCMHVHMVLACLCLHWTCAQLGHIISSYVFVLLKIKLMKITLAVVPYYSNFFPKDLLLLSNNNHIN